MNEKLIRYSGLIKTRETLLKKAKQDSINRGVTTPTSKISSLHVASANGDDFDFNQNQKKTVAASGKHMQLSSVNNEA